MGDPKGGKVGAARQRRPYQSLVGRTCRSAPFGPAPPVSEDDPCPVCALAGAFATLGFDEPPPSAPRFSPIELPSRFRHYRVDREIAAGGMGMVYEAWTLNSGGAWL